MARIWNIHIPVRPKAVQSVRGGRNGFYQDPSVRKWKNTIRPFIASACSGPPTTSPVRINKLLYTFRYPKTMPAKVREYIANGGVIPYIGKADITDNLAKGLIDVCKGLIFEDDVLIWKTCDISKVYGEEDGIDIEVEETPDVMLIR